MFFFSDSFLSLPLSFSLFLENGAHGGGYKAGRNRVCSVSTMLRPRHALIGDGLRRPSAAAYARTRVGKCGGRGSCRSTGSWHDAASSRFYGLQLFGIAARGGTSRPADLTLPAEVRVANCSHDAPTDRNRLVSLTFATFEIADLTLLTMITPPTIVENRWLCITSHFPKKKNPNN